MQTHNQSIQPNDTIIGRLAMHTAAMNTPMTMNSPINNQQPPSINSIPKPNTEIVPKSRSNSQTIIKGPTRVTFNSREVSPPPSNIMANMPIH